MWKAYLTITIQFYIVAFCKEIIITIVTLLQNSHILIYQTFIGNHSKFE